MARIISAAYNYTVNYKIVFKSKENMGKAAWQYALLADRTDGVWSALLATGGVKASAIYTGSSYKGNR